MMDLTIREICLICKGERWIPDPLDPARSKPCPYCDGQGWVEISPANFVPPPPPAPSTRDAA